VEKNRFKEIERKFLVKGDYKPFVKESIQIVQGYLSSNPQRSVRVRLKGSKGFLTVKGESNKGGTTRFEWETGITKEEAEKLLQICEAGVIDKTRNIINVNQHVYEVDEFYGENEGLVLAEIELSSENETFEKPAWLGEEVTGDAKYYNAMLSKNPFKSW
jgi:adenylate cyclase